MGFLWWGRKEEVEDKLKDDIKKSFSNVKEDFKRTSEWIKHLHTKDSNHESNLKELSERVSSLESEMEEMKKFVYFFGPKVFKQPFKQQQTAVDKQTAVEAVQTRVQTAVENRFLKNFSTMERAILVTLLNSDMKLSYEDLASMLGKERSTIRGQINSIRQKSEGLIEDFIEKNGKKRLYIPEHMKAIIFKNIKTPQKKREKR